MDLIREQYGELAEPGPLESGPNDIKFWVRREFVLVRDEYADRAREILRRHDMLPPDSPDAADAAERGGSPQDRDVAYGMQWIRLRPGTGVAVAVAVVNERLRGVASAEHLVHISGSTGSGCPATEPVPVPLGTPPDPGVTPDRLAGEGVTVAVVDTGLDHRTARLLPWLRGVRGDPDPGVGQAGAGHYPYAGHGTFIAGVVRSMAPRARVVVRSAFPTGGCSWELAIVAGLERVLQQDHPDVISLSAGTHTLTPSGLTLFNGFAAGTLANHKGVAIVAAAGNDGWSLPFWPAAAPWTTSAGALDEDWHRRAWFSNHGGWVDVYAPGHNLVNAFPAGWFTYRERKHFGRTVRFRGMARWSGTSFSTPMVAGLIAARMSHTGENARTAAAALVAGAQAGALPGVGAVLTP
jgi:hypothetical protein